MSGSTFGLFSSGRSSTLANAAISSQFTNDKMLTWLTRLFLIVAGSALLALSAQFKVPLAWVPVTAQTLVVLLIGMTYGRYLGAATVIAYLLEGGFGMPVFAGGAAGWLTVTGPTGGYLIGFVAAAFVMGVLAERGMGRNVASTAIAMLIGTVVIYAGGVVWLSNFVGSFERAITVGVMPFLVGDFLKLVVAAGLMPLAWKAIKKLEGK